MNGLGNVATSVNSSPKKKLAAKTRTASVVSKKITVQASLACWFIPASIALLTFVAFLPTLQNGFVNWDDEAFLLDNPHYRGLGWEQLRWMFTTCYLGSCMPLNYVTYGLDYVIWGMNPVGYHLSSLLIHAANASLFYFVSLRLLRLAVPGLTTAPQLPVRLAAGTSALLFSLHPLRVEAVAWTLGREIAVAGFFFFLTLLCYLNATENNSTGARRWRWMGAAWILYSMSLLGKEAALTLPFALLVLDFYPLRHLGGDQGSWFGSHVRRVWWEKIPFLLVAVAAGVKAMLAKEQSGTLYAMSSYGLLPRFAQVLDSLAFYPWKTLVPVGLSPLYPLRPSSGIWNLPLLLNGLSVLLLTVALFIGRRRWPAGLATWFFYVILLIPVSGIVAFGPYRAADRFSYLPCLGWAVLVGAGVLHYWQLGVSGRVSIRTRFFTQSFAALLLIGLAALTWQQTQVWYNSERLWRHALALEENSSFAHNNLGLVLAERGALEEAIKEFRRALEIDSASVEAYTNLGNFLARTGSREEAIVHLRHALQIAPTFVSAHNTLGNILADSGALDEAIEHFHEGLRIDPKSAVTHYNLARALAKRGDFEEAIARYRMALQINPADPDVHNNLALLLARRGSIAEAVQQFSEAARINPGYAKAHFNLGKIFAQQGRLDEAVQNFKQALRIQPEVAEIHENLARVLARQGKQKEALQEYQEALRLLHPGSEGNAVR